MKVTLISNYLDDTAVANFARKSFNDDASKYTDAQNSQLIKYLARGVPTSDWEQMEEDVVSTTSLGKAHNLLTYARSIPCHFAPFGHPQISLNIEAPVPIARQMFKHKVGFIESEESRRYISVKPQFFYPENWRDAAANVKQGSASTTHKDNEELKTLYADCCDYCEYMYTDFLNRGVCPEQARFLLPQGTEVRWSLTGSLFAFANLYNQRSDSHAQKEIQDLAEDIGDIVEKLYPVSWAALTRGEY